MELCGETDDRLDRDSGKPLVDEVEATGDEVEACLDRETVRTGTAGRTDDEARRESLESGLINADIVEVVCTLI